MEAKALYDFTGQTAEEINFRKGATLKITGKDDESWFRAELNGNEGVVPSNYIEFKPPVWYMTVSKDEAVKLLLAKQGSSYQHRDGAFLIRPSESNPGEISLSVKTGNVQHFKILRSAQRDKYYLWQNEPEFKSVNQLIQHYRSASVTKNGHVTLQDMQFSKVVANYDFVTRSTDELELKRGDVILVSSKDDPEWWNGFVERDGNICHGMFPASYVSQYGD